MEVESCVPPGFRFHPTEEELVGYYLTRKVASQKIDLDVIRDIDLYRIEPWDLKDRCKYGYEEQTEWYFFSHKDKKYPSGTRTNRATAAGFWKATGRDKAVLSKSKIIGMRKTLVFYQGRAPSGRKSDWIMHEYRLQTSEHALPQEEGWVVCRAFRKQTPNQRPYYNTFNTAPYCSINRNQTANSFGSDEICHSTKVALNSYTAANFQDHQALCFSSEHESRQAYLNYMLDIPQLDSPSISTSCLKTNNNVMTTDKEECHNSQFLDWKVLDKLLGSQLSSDQSAASCSNSNLPIITSSIQNQDEDHYFASFDVHE